MCLAVYRVSISNEQPLRICTRVGMATVLSYIGVVYHGMYLQEFIQHMTMYTVCFSYTREYCS